MNKRTVFGKFLSVLTRRWLLWSFAATIVSTPAMAQPCARDRAIWIYQTPYDVVRNLEEREALFPASQGIGEFFLSVTISCGPSGEACQIESATYRRQLRDLIKKAHVSGIRVHALSGNPTLALAENHNKVRSRINAILAFNMGGEPDEKFDGIHLDVEPYLLPKYREAVRDGNWDAVRSIIRQFLDMNAAALEVAGRDLNYAVDIPDFWHPFIDESGVLDQRLELLLEYRGTLNYPTYHVMDMVKDVTIMSYHRNPDAIRRKTEHAMEYAARPEVGAAVYVGVQTAPPCEPGVDPPQPRDCRPASETLGGGTRREMEQALCLIDSALAGYVSFRGFSYYKYSTYRDMVP